MQISSVCRGRSSSWSTTGQEVVARFAVFSAASELHNLPRELTALINRETFTNNMQKRSQLLNAFPRVRGVGLVVPWVPSSTLLQSWQARDKQQASRVHGGLADPGRVRLGSRGVPLHRFSANVRTCAQNHANSLEHIMSADI